MIMILMHEPSQQCSPSYSYDKTSRFTSTIQSPFNVAKLFLNNTLQQSVPYTR